MYKQNIKLLMILIVKKKIKKFKSKLNVKNKKQGIIENYFIKN